MRRFAALVIDVKKYGGKEVAIVRGRIVASGVTTKEILGEVRRKLPASTWRDILLVSVPAGITVVYRLLAGLRRPTRSGIDFIGHVVQ